MRGPSGQANRGFYSRSRCFRIVSYVSWKVSFFVLRMMHRAAFLAPGYPMVSRSSRRGRDVEFYGNLEPVARTPSEGLAVEQDPQAIVARL